MNDPNDLYRQGGGNNMGGAGGGPPYQSPHQPYGGNPPYQGPAQPGYGGQQPYSGPHPYQGARTKGNSAAFTIVVIVSVFAYLLFFTLYFTGALDSMFGRRNPAPATLAASSGFPDQLIGHWCWVDQSANEKSDLVVRRDGFDQVQVTGGQPQPTTSRAWRSSDGNTYVTIGSATGRAFKSEMFVDSTGILHERQLEIEGRRVPANEEYPTLYRRCT